MIILEADTWLYSDSIIEIRENMNVQLPAYIKRWPFAPKGRFYVYPASRMVTHHIEDIQGGMERKKFHFNSIVGFDYFDVSYKNNKSFVRFMCKTAHTLDKLLLRRSWYTKRTANHL